MRTRLLVIGVLVAAVLAGALLFDAHSGSALDDSAGISTGITKVNRGDDVYFLAPTLTNRSGRALELRTVRPDKTSPGLEFVEARVYEKDAFVGGAPLSWATGLGEGINPAAVRSASTAGRKVAADADLDALIYLHFRVTGEQRPLTSSGVRIGYHRGLRDHTQVLDSKYEVGGSSDS
jgi:hypothetical protein